jgi:hypothetical protein
MKPYILTLFFVSLAGCTNVVQLYDGQELPDTGVAVIWGTSVQNTMSQNENYRFQVVKINGKKIDDPGFKKLEMLPGNYIFTFKVLFVRNFAPTRVFWNEAYYELPVVLRKNITVNLGFSEVQGNERLCIVYRNSDIATLELNPTDYPLEANFDTQCSEVAIQFPGYSWTQVGGSF